MCYFGVGQDFDHLLVLVLKAVGRLIRLLTAWCTLQHAPSLSNAPVQVYATLRVGATLLVLAAATVEYHIHSHNICATFNGIIHAVLGVWSLLGLKF